MSKDELLERLQSSSTDASELRELEEEFWTLQGEKNKILEDYDEFFESLIEKTSPGESVTIRVGRRGSVMIERTDEPSENPIREALRGREKTKTEEDES